MAHVKSYADLVTEASQLAFTAWKLRLLMYALALTSLFLSLISATVSVLLWAALPVLNELNFWVLITLPMALLALSGIFYALAQRYKQAPWFSDVQEQLSLDLIAICQASAK